MTEKTCPDCGHAMSFHEGGYSDRCDAFGEHYQEEYPDTWYCWNCHHSESVPEETENKEYA